jgi:hypothetical protein
VTENVAVDEPKGTVTDDGAEADVAFELRLTLIPLAGAGELNVTVPVDGVPPTTLVGVSVNPVRVGGLIVSQALTELGPRVAEIWAAVCEATG